MDADTIILAVIIEKLGLPENCTARQILCAIEDLQDKVAGDLLDSKKPYLLTWTPGESGGEITDANGDEYFFKKPNAVEMAKDILANPIARTPSERIAELERDPHRKQALESARERINKHCFGSYMPADGGPDAIRSPERLKNNLVCPHYNLHCGWPKCNDASLTN
jgi:hypothetical protein